MININKQALRDKAESTIGILENIAGFEPSDIDGDAVELRFETDGGFDTGCDVSIVDQCQKAADVVRALLGDSEALALENIRLKAGISGLIGLGIRHGDVEVMRLAGDAQMSTPCTDSILENIAAGIKIKGE